MPEIRILTATSVRGITFPANSIIDLEDAEAKEAVANGWADDHPDAVAYAESIGGHDIAAQAAHDAAAKL